MGVCSSVPVLRNDRRACEKLSFYISGLGWDMGTVGTAFYIKNIRENRIGTKPGNELCG
jgi:hypothetical protein